MTDWRLSDRTVYPKPNNRTCPFGGAHLFAAECFISDIFQSLSVGIVDALVCRQEAWR
jgi:hypothetical protein